MGVRTIGWGRKGDKGDSSSISVGTTSSGTPAAVTNSGTSTNAILNFVIPSGANGSNSTWFVGVGAPIFSANVGDMYLDSSTGNVWQMD